jgi:uncharacterized membrane protein YcaP (DUF421 family)
MDIAFRGAALFAFIFLLTRVIVLGDTIQQGLTQDDYSVTGSLIAVGTIAGLQVLTSYTSFRFRWARRLLDGDPIVLMQDGKVIEKNLRRERLTVEEIAEQARSSQIASLDDVQWAVFEPSGAISFIPKQ